MRKKVTTQANRINQLKVGTTRADKRGINTDKGTTAPISNGDDKPDSRGASRDFKDIFMIGLGSGRLSDTSELHGKSAPTSESSTLSTPLTSQRPWIHWTSLAPLSHRPPTQLTQWRLNVGSMCTKST